MQPLRGSAPLVVLLATGWGLLLRIRPLGGLTLWYDELISVTLAQRPFPLDLYSALIYEPHPPLYTLLLSLWVIPSTGTSWILLGSVVVGTASIPALYLSSRRMYGDAAGAAGAVLLAIHPAAIYWSHFARMYAPIILLVIAIFGCGTLFLHRPRRGLLAAFVTLEIALLWIHVAGWFFLLPVLLLLLGEARARRLDTRQAIRAQGVVLAAGLLPLAGSLLRGGLAHMEAPRFLDLVGDTLRFFSVGPARLAGGGRMDALGLHLILLPLVMLAALALFFSRKQTRPLALFLVAVPVLAFAVSHAARPMWLVERTSSFMIPFWCLALGLLLFPARNRLPDGPARSRPPLPAIGVVALLALLQVQGSVAYLRHPAKGDPHEEFARIVESREREADLVVTAVPQAAWAMRWFLHGPGWDRELPARLETARSLRETYDIIKAFDRGTTGGTVRVATLEKNLPDLASRSRIWVVSRSRQQTGEIEKRLGAGWRRVWSDALGASTRLHVYARDGLTFVPGG